LNSVTELTDENEDVQNEYRYKAFGEALQVVEMVDNEYRFTARRWDGVDGIQFNRFRHYQPRFGRWNHWDVIRYGDGVNMYGYVGNQPVVNVDSLGLLAPVLPVMFKPTKPPAPPSCPLPPTKCPSGTAAAGKPATFTRCYSSCSSKFWYLKPISIMTKGISWLWGGTAAGTGVAAGSATLIKIGKTVASAGAILSSYPTAYYTTYCGTKCIVDPCAY
jgi:RHS repeat-associated protein